MRGRPRAKVRFGEKFEERALEFLDLFATALLGDERVVEGLAGLGREDEVAEHVGSQRRYRQAAASWPESPGAGSCGPIHSRAGRVARGGRRSPPRRGRRR